MCLIRGKTQALGDSEPCRFELKGTARRVVPFLFGYMVYLGVSA